MPVEQVDIVVDAPGITIQEDATTIVVGAALGLTVQDESDTIVVNASQDVRVIEVGTPGPAGAAGADGAQGPQGDQGPKGDDADDVEPQTASNIQVSTVSSSSPSITIDVDVDPNTHRFHEITVEGAAGTMALQTDPGSFGTSLAGQTKLLRIKNSTSGNLTLEASVGSMVSAAKLVGGAAVISTGEVGLIELRMYSTRTETLWVFMGTSQ